MFTCILYLYCTLLHCITTFSSVLHSFHLANNVSTIFLQFRGKYDIISTQRARPIMFSRTPGQGWLSLQSPDDTEETERQSLHLGVVFLILILIFSGVVSSWLHHNCSHRDYMWLIYLSPPLLSSPAKHRRYRPELSSFMRSRSPLAYRVTAS